jgi:hypothetical protein
MKTLQTIILGAAVLAAPMISSAAVSTWNGSTDSDWDIASNWDNGVPTSSYQAVISNGNTVTKTGDISLNDVASSTEDGLQLTSGVLNVTGNLTSTSAGGADSSINNNLGVSDGSTTGTLAISGTLTLGTTNTTTSAVSSFNIYTGSSLTADAFQGRQGYYGSAGTGGWALNVLGGTVNFTTFDFSTLSSVDSSNPTGILTIGTTGTASGGTVNIGTMSDDWAREGQYVLFNDILGSLTFGKTNYENIADVEALIDGDYIRMDSGITTYDFSIADNGSSWTVTLGAAIPEPSSFAALAGVMALGAVMVRRRRT